MQYSTTALLLLLTMNACDQEPATPSTEVLPAFATAGIDQNMVLRYQDHFANSWTDANNGLRATHTTFAIPFGDPPRMEKDCGPQADLATINFRQVGVVNPLDFFASELHLNANGPVWIIVRDLNQAGDCYGVKLIAEGPGEIRYLDNDAFGVSPDQTSANSWGFIASGTLTTPAGRKLTYEGEARYVVNVRDGEQTFVPAVERVTLH
jgi:hypothetical protein